MMSTRPTVVWPLALGKYCSASDWLVVVSMTEKPRQLAGQLTGPVKLTVAIEPLTVALWKTTEVGVCADTGCATQFITNMLAYKLEKPSCAMPHLSFRHRGRTVSGLMVGGG